jgi:hypothetical protein
VAVITDGIDHRDCCPEASGHHRLVGALATEPGHIGRPDDGLAIAGQAVRVRDLVDHRAADDDDPWAAHVTLHRTSLRLAPAT